MSEQAFTVGFGDVVTVTSFKHGVGIDVETESDSVMLNLDTGQATEIGLALFAAAGAQITEIGLEDGDDELFDGNEDDDLLAELLFRLADAADEADNPVLKQNLIVMGSGFLLDRSEATRAVIRKLVGA